MTNDKRREEILEILKNADKAISATALAEKFGVTRQIIVADIALLRASGNAIRAEHRGYVIERQFKGISKKIVCKHDKSGVRDEFYAIVDNGGSVVNVEVEHPIYGQISANMSISSRYDADEFIRETSEAGATQLSDLTGGIHIHTINVNDEKNYARICDELKRIGILVCDD
ncbi:MAG: transcription repressor NadR [Ruminococcaceae bacterium]|nr:transcription repressor NadR [Oscillospiraceae bacterium]